MAISKENLTHAGVRLNLSKRGVSARAGIRGVGVTLGSAGGGPIVCTEAPLRPQLAASGGPGWAASNSSAIALSARAMA
jgi:Protein of unknown function (DUF4236)